MRHRRHRIYISNTSRCPRKECTIFFLSAKINRAIGVAALSSEPLDRRKFQGNLQIYTITDFPATQTTTTAHPLQHYNYQPRSPPLEKTPAPPMAQRCYWHYATVCQLFLFILSFLFSRGRDALPNVWTTRVIIII